MTNEIDNSDHALNTRQAAALVGLTPGSLAVLRSRGSGPPVHYAGAKPIYFAGELRTWIAECTAKMRQKREERAVKQAEAAAQ